MQLLSAICYIAKNSQHLCAFLPLDRYKFPVRAKVSGGGEKGEGINPMSGITSFENYFVMLLVLY